MSQLKTALEPTSINCPRPLPSAHAHAFPLRRFALAIAVIASMAGCASNTGAWEPNDKLVAMPVSAVGHYGRGIGVPRYSLGDLAGGNNSGWGGGGSTSCCVLVPRDISKPVMVKVKWTTYRSNVDEERQHEATVPVHFAVHPDEGGSALVAHFLPGHQVELWYANPYPTSTEYPGPKYPFQPGPRYVPLPNEKPEPPAGEFKD